MSRPRKSYETVLCERCKLVGKSGRCYGKDLTGVECSGSVRAIYKREGICIARRQRHGK